GPAGCSGRRSWGLLLAGGLLCDGRGGAVYRRVGLGGFEAVEDVVDGQLAAGGAFGVLGGVVFEGGASDGALGGCLFAECLDRGLEVGVVCGDCLVALVVLGPADPVEQTAGALELVESGHRRAAVLRDAFLQDMGELLCVEFEPSVAAVSQRADRGAVELDLDVLSHGSVPPWGLGGAEE